VVARREADVVWMEGDHKGRPHLRKLSGLRVGIECDSRVG